MKQIKYRAWDLQSNLGMGKVDILHFEPNTKCHILFLNDKFKSEYDYPKWRHYAGLYKNCELMQYTGLKDKNGVEVYEGDIYKYGITGKHIIRFDYAALSSLQLNNVEVIGNIYEHKELLNDN